MSHSYRRGWIIAGISIGVLVLGGGAVAYARNAGGWLHGHGHGHGPMSAEIMADRAGAQLQSICAAHRRAGEISQIVACQLLT